MATLRLTPRELGVILTNQHRKLKATIDTANERAAHRAIVYLQKQTPVGAGPEHMAQAWEVTKQSRNYIVHNTAPYAGIVERGARPHNVNREGVDAIRKWVIAKGIIAISKPLPVGVHGPVRAPRALTRKQAEGKYAPMVESVVWAIVGKIKKEGQKPTWFVRDSLPKLNNILADEVSRAIGELLSEQP